MIAIAAAMLGGSVGMALAQQNPPKEDPPSDKPIYDPDSILVRFDLGELAKLDPIMYELTLGLVGGESAKQYRIVPGLELIRLNKGELKVTVEEAIERLKILPYVKYAEPDYYLYPLETPDDPLFEDQWHLHNTGQTGGTSGADINAPEAWDFITAAPDVLIAVIDSGIRFDHPDLDDNIWENQEEVEGVANEDDDGNGYVDDFSGWDFFDGDNDPTEASSEQSRFHGTTVAGVIGAEGDNTAGVSGIIWESKIVPLRIGSDLLSETLISEAVGALDYCYHTAITVSNSSWFHDSPTPSSALYDAIEALQDIGHIFVAGAGNSGDDGAVFPAGYGLDNIISVAATDDEDALWVDSNFGASSVDLGAPGVGVLTTWWNQLLGPPGDPDYISPNGTSFAAPCVAAACAMLYQLHPTWTYSQVRDRVLWTTRWLPALEGKTVTGGMLDLGAAVSDVLNAPTNLQASVSSGTVSLTWNDNSSDESGFTCERIKLGTGGAWGSYATFNKAANSTSHSQTPSSGTYRYRLRAYHSSGVSNWTPWVQVTN